MITRFVVFTILFCVLTAPVLAKTDRAAEDYLKNKHHFSILNPFAERVIQKEIKKSLKKETNASFNVDFDAYTISSLKQGVFKSLEIEGENIEIENMVIPYIYIKSISDYNRIDYKQKPIIIKSDMVYEYKLKLNEENINTALNTPKYQKNIQKINDLAYPLFILQDVNIKIRHNKVYIIMEYNIPLAPHRKNKTFMVSSKFSVDSGKIKAKDIVIDKSYGNLSLEKVANLVNLIDPLSFTLSIINKKDCKAKVESVNIEENIIEINGKIFVKGEQK